MSSKSESEPASDFDSESVKANRARLASSLLASSSL